MYRHLRPLWPLLLTGYGLKRPFAAPILPALIVGAIGFGRAATWRGLLPGGPIASGIGYAVVTYLMFLWRFLARRDAEKHKQDAQPGD